MFSRRPVWHTAGDVGTKSSAPAILGDEHEIQEQEQEQERIQQEREEQARKVQALIDTGAARGIPAELIARILSFIGASGEMGVVEYGKVELGLCALVCRFWASIFQPKLFRELTLSCVKDARQLLAMVARPGSKLAQYIEGLKLRGQDIIGFAYCFDGGESFGPWARYFSPLQAQLTSCDRFQLISYTSGLTQTRTWRTAHWDLPRSIITPAHALRKFNLHNTAMASFADFVSLLDGLPDLRELHCCALTWVTAPSFTKLRSNRPKCSHLEHVELSECQNDAHALWLLAVYRAPAEARLTRSSADIAALSLFLKTISLDKSPPVTLCASRNQHTLKASLGDKGSDSTLLWKTDTSPTTDTRGAERIAHLVTLDLSDRSDADFDDVLHSDWESLDKLVASFTSVHNITVGFCSEQHGSCFWLEVVEAKMTRVRKRLQIKCAILHHVADGALAWEHERFFVPYDYNAVIEGTQKPEPKLLWQL